MAPSPSHLWHARRLDSRLRGQRGWPLRGQPRGPTGMEHCIQLAVVLPVVCVCFGRLLDMRHLRWAVLTRCLPQPTRTLLLCHPRSWFASSPRFACWSTCGEFDHTECGPWHGGSQVKGSTGVPGRGTTDVETCARMHACQRGRPDPGAGTAQSREGGRRRAGSGAGGGAGARAAGPARVGSVGGGSFFLIDFASNGPVQDDQATPLLDKVTKFHVKISQNKQGVNRRPCMGCLQ